MPPALLLSFKQSKLVCHSKTRVDEQALITSSGEDHPGKDQFSNLFWHSVPVLKC